MTFPAPLVIATAHQKNITTLREKIQADAGCIRQLLVGRKVRRRGSAHVFLVTETRMNLTGVVEVRGKNNDIIGPPKGRVRHIGTVNEIEILP